MLRERYNQDAKYWALIEELAIEMEPELAEIDKVLEDEALFQQIKQDMARRYPRTLTTGRPSSPVEVVLRMLVVKRLYGFTYRETIWHVRDSLVLRWFCRVYFEAVPDSSTLDRWAQTLGPETLHAFNERVTTLATALKVSRGRKLRTDGTVVETNIAYPSDSHLLADGVRVLSQSTLKRIQAKVGEVSESAAGVFRDRTRSARTQLRRIQQAARRRSQAAQAEMQTAYQRLVEITRASVRQAKTVVHEVHTHTAASVQKLAEQMEKQWLPRVEQVIEQSVRRVFQGESVPAAEKLVSLFEPHTNIIRRQKPGKETEFGHKVWLDEVDGGIVTRWQVLEGNPPDDQQWQPALDHHIEQFGHPPWQASADRGVYSPDNQAYATKRGVKQPILPQPGRKTPQRRHHEAQAWFKRGRRYHAGIEGRISVLKRKHQLDRCLDHGEDGFDKWVGWGIIAANLAVIARTLAAKAA